MPLLTVEVGLLVVRSRSKGSDRWLSKRNVPMAAREKSKRDPGAPWRTLSRAVPGTLARTLA